MLSEARLIRNIPAQAGTGDPDPGARAGEARAHVRGACRRERGESRIPMAERIRKGFAIAARFRAPQLFLQSGLPHRAAQPTLVVKISDTSLQRKERVRIPPVMSRTVEAPGEGSHAPRLRILPQGKDRSCTDSDIARSPACFPKMPVRKLRQGDGEDVCYFGKSAGRPRAVRRSRVQIPPAEMP